MKLEVTLITGRSLNQGRGLAQGKESVLYQEETSTVDLSENNLSRLGLKSGDPVVVSTSFGQGSFVCRQADLPDYLAFIPYGPGANKLTDPTTSGSGMPLYKGLAAWVRRGGDGCS